MNSHVIDESGRKYNRWTVLHRAENDEWQCAQFLCRCDCGTERVVLASTLRRGTSKSCGCLQKEATLARITKHGMHQSRTYHIWEDMIQRTTNPNVPNTKDYLGRGITVCNRWRDFKNFLDDMGVCPDDLTIHRLDNDAGYFPGNCKWATKDEQSRGKSKRRRTKSQYRGVTWRSGSEDWWARVTLAKGVYKTAGIRKDEEEAALLRDAAVLEYGLTLDILNFPYLRAKLQQYVDCKKALAELAA